MLGMMLQQRSCKPMMTKPGRGRVKNPSAFAISLTSRGEHFGCRPFDFHLVSRSVDTRMPSQGGRRPGGIRPPKTMLFLYQILRLIGAHLDCFIRSRCSPDFSLSVIHLALGHKTKLLVFHDCPLLLPSQGGVRPGVPDLVRSLQIEFLREARKIKSHRFGTL